MLFDHPDDDMEIDSEWLGTIFETCGTWRLSFGHKNSWGFYPKCGDLESCVCYEGRVMIQGPITRGQVRQVIKLFNLC